MDLSRLLNNGTLPGDDHCRGKPQTQHRDYGKGTQEERHRLVQIESRADMMAYDRIEREVFLRFSRVRNVELVNEPLKYLYGIARNVVREIRERRRQELVEFDSDLTDHRSEHPPDHPTDKVAC
jgi:hypothetical protein